MKHAWVLHALIIFTIVFVSRRMQGIAYSPVHAVAESIPYILAGVLFTVLWWVFPPREKWAWFQWLNKSFLAALIFTLGLLLMEVTVIAELAKG